MIKKNKFTHVICIHNHERTTNLQLGLANVNRSHGLGSYPSGNGSQQLKLPMGCLGELWNHPLDLGLEFLTGHVSRKRKNDLIDECRTQLLAERAAADAATALLSLDPVAPVEDQAEPEAETEAEPEVQPEAQAAPPDPVTGNKRNRGQLKSKGSILHNPARGQHKPDNWTVTYKRTRNTFYSQAEAEAALRNYKEFDICPCCDQAPPIPPVPPAPIPSIRCVALAAGVIQVSINGVTLTVDGAFTYP